MDTLGPSNLNSSPAIRTDLDLEQLRGPLGVLAHRALQPGRTQTQDPPWPLSLQDGFCPHVPSVQVEARNKAERRQQGKSPARPWGPQPLHALSFQEKFSHSEARGVMQGAGSAPLPSGSERQGQEVVVLGVTLPRRAVGRKGLLTPWLRCPPPPRAPCRRPTNCRTGSSRKRDVTGLTSASPS